MTLEARQSNVEQNKKLKVTRNLDCPALQDFMENRKKNEFKGRGVANNPRKGYFKIQNRVISKGKTKEIICLKKGFLNFKSNDIRNYMAGDLTKKVGGFRPNLTLKKGLKNPQTCEDLDHQGAKHVEQEKFT